MRLAFERVDSVKHITLLNAGGRPPSYGGGLIPRLTAGGGTPRLSFLVLVL